MERIILFGGAFDPIHFGHLQMAECASKQLGAKVLFIPAKISVWKNESAPVKDKIEMIKLAIKDFNRENVFDVSDYEASLENDTNYTIDTVKHFKKAYPNSEIYLLIGQDQVNSFHDWKDADELAKLVKVIYFGRETYSRSENVKRFNMMTIDGEINNYNSTDIRNLHSLDTTDGVINYIIDNDLYFMQEIKSRMHKDRYIHSKSVALLSYEIAKSNSVDKPKRALIAGLVHDCGKELPKEIEAEIMKTHYSEYLYLDSIVYHQFTGEYLAKKVFGIEDPSILNAIKYHTTACGEMDDIAKIVYCADKIEPTRGFGSEKLINSMKSSLKKGFDDVMTSNIEYYVNHKVDYLNPLTKACLDRYYKK